MPPVQHRHAAVAHVGAPLLNCLLLSAQHALSGQLLLQMNLLL
jgi:hypothetical protein